jgi:hypothetical protein
MLLALQIVLNAVTDNKKEQHIFSNVDDDRGRHFYSAFEVNFFKNLCMIEQSMLKSKLKQWKIYIILSFLFKKSLFTFSELPSISL